MGNNEKYTVPDYMNNIIDETDNGYLLMHRFLMWKGDKNINNLKPVYFNAPRLWPKKLQNPLQNSGLTFQIQNPLQTSGLTTQIKNDEKAMKNSQIYDINLFSMKQTWNMVVGLGTTSASETSMTLHHIYGIPYIPGQTLKGIVRSYIICEFFENDEEEAVKDDLFVRMFGRGEIKDKDGKIYDSKQGVVIFFDAVPINGKNINFTVDIMNNHHKRYYENNDLKLLNDSENPNLVKMLVINGAEFAFRIAIKKKNNDGKGSKLYFKGDDDGRIKRKSLLESAVRYTQSALQFCGAGAKTAVGYGRFKELKNI